jgi:hypothetical protein
MILCPIAMAVGCKRCFAVSVCPLKTVIGDYAESPKPLVKARAAKAKAKRKPGKSR